MVGNSILKLPSSFANILLVTFSEFNHVNAGNCFIVEFSVNFPFFLYMILINPNTALRKCIIFFLKDIHQKTSRRRKY